MHEGGRNHVFPVVKRELRGSRRVLEGSHDLGGEGCPGIILGQALGSADPVRE